MSMLMFESAFPVLAVAASASAPVARRGRRRSAAANAVKEYAQMSTAEKRLFNLEKARAARAASVQAAPPASAPEKVDAAPAKKGEYVRTNVKLTNYGHGRRETEIDGLRVGIAWDGTKSIFVYVIGKKVFVGGATRDVAVAKLNAALAEQGLPPVRA